MRRSIIVAAAKNGVIGAGGKIPWYLSDDLRRFRTLTMGHCLIMGRKTYDSIGKPLPGRTTIVLSRRRMEYPESVFAASSFAEAVERAEQLADNEVFVCGGGEVYAEALPHCDRIYLTLVDRDYDGDARFSMPRDGWALVERAEVGGDPPHRFDIYDRVRRS